MDHANPKTAPASKQEDIHRSKMAAFFAKHVKHVKKSMTGVSKDNKETNTKEGEKEKEGEERVDPEVVEARRKLAMQKWKETYILRKEKREEFRQYIREKYGLTKPELVVEEQCMAEGCNKETPAELVREKDEVVNNGLKSSAFAANCSELQSKEHSLSSKCSGRLKHKTNKCVVQ